MLGRAGFTGVKAPVDEQVMGSTTHERHYEPNKKASPAVFASKAFGVETTGIEPATSGMQSQPSVVPSANPSEVMASESVTCTTDCTSEPDMAGRIRLKSVSGAVPTGTVNPSDGDFAKTLLMIATLPLSDSDKAEAVRRLLWPDIGVQIIPIWPDNSDS